MPSENREETMTEAANRRGLHIVPADDYTLQVDVDAKPGSLSDHERAISEGRRRAYDMFFEWLASDETLVTISASGNQHYYYRLKKPLPPLARVALQAILGSDPSHEMLNLLRILDGTDPSMVLFETDDGLRGVKEFYDTAPLPQGD